MVCFQQAFGLSRMGRDRLLEALLGSGREPQSLDRARLWLIAHFRLDALLHVPYAAMYSSSGL